MIYIILLKPKQKHKLKSEEHIFELQSKIIHFIKDNFVNIKYTLLLVDNHIIEEQLKHIDKKNDTILWHPNLAANNLSILKQFINNIVILKNKTVLLQKLSDRNPINENMAINHNFNLMYIDEDYDDVTNLDWKLVIKPQIITIQQFQNISKTIN